MWLSTQVSWWSKVLGVFSAPIPISVAAAIGILTPMVQAAPAPDIELQVGIVQRFGDRPRDQITLKAPPGDRLTLRFQTGDGKLQTLTTETLKLETIPQTLAQPVTDERVIFSTHRSFETAEEQAQSWRTQGVEVELAQPDRWQVWAKRSTYHSPLLRRLLLRSLQAKGLQARLESKTVQQVPRLSWAVGNYRYTRDWVDITAGKGPIAVDREQDNQPSRRYPGALRLQPNAYGNYTVVNFVGLETYLRGVVPHEIGTLEPQSVLEAQAVLARTYALRNLRRFSSDRYQLCATTQCQVYWGIGDAMPQTDRAIAATRGLVLTYQKELVDALYSSTSGGVTAAFGDIWRGGERPYLRTVIDAVKPAWDLGKQNLADEQNFRRFISQTNGYNETGSRMFRWRYGRSLDQLNRELRTYLQAIQHPLSRFKTIQTLQVIQRAASGRVLKTKIVTDAGPLELEKDDIQTAFDAPASTLFYVEPMLDAKTKVLRGFTFVGGGFGHGVGLSQIGSYKLGQLGWSSDRILGFYFPGTQLQPIGPALSFWREMTPKVPIAPLRPASPPTSTTLFTGSESRLQK